MKYLITGLGNIGQEYESTRHNIGFMVLDHLASEHNIDFKVDRYAQIAELKYKGRQYHLIKPSTYMNNSGKAVRYWMNELKIPKQKTLVVVDEIALPFGSLRMRSNGSAAGHNGLKNIEDLTGGKDYPRLRFGIGDDFPKGGQVNYVLSEFTSKERDELGIFIDKASQMVLSFGTAGIERTMNQFND